MNRDLSLWPDRRIGEFQVSPIGLGCMNLSHAYGVPPSKAEATALLHRALDLGFNLFDTAALYGFGANESLVGEVLAPHRSKFVLASKCGMQGVATAEGMKRVIDGRPETLRATCEDSLRRLRTDVIDLYYLHRWDKRVPIEDSVGALAGLVRAGKVRAIGLSEVSASTLRRAHAVYPIAAVQSEYSLWTRNPELGVLDACRELGTAFVAFSPLGRGFLAGGLADPSALQPRDIRLDMPRFAPSAFGANLAWLAALREASQELGCSLAQLALAWLLGRGEYVIALPGTTQQAHLEDNLSALYWRLPPELVRQFDEQVNSQTVAGARYSAANQGEIDTEEFPLDPLETVDRGIAP